MSRSPPSVRSRAMFETCLVAWEPPLRRRSTGRFRAGTVDDRSVSPPSTGERVCSPARVRFVRSRSAPSIDVVQEALMQAVGVPMIHWDVRRPPGLVGSEKNNRRDIEPLSTVNSSENWNDDRRRHLVERTPDTCPLFSCDAELGPFSQITYARNSIQETLTHCSSAPGALAERASARTRLGALESREDVLRPETISTSYLARKVQPTFISQCRSETAHRIGWAATTVTAPIAVSRPASPREE